MNKIISALFTVLIFYCIGSGIILSQDSDSVQLTISDSLQADSTIITQEPIIYKIGDITDGGKSVPVHLIKLFDQNGFSIHSTDKYLLPYSTKNTCGDCHTYEFIKNGTHFSIDTKDSTDHIGEPFILSNHRNLTVLPLSYRGWEGTIHPDSVGIKPFDFIKIFGSHITGGNLSENEDLEHLDNYFRWQVSGKLEINCLVCHDADPEYDQAEFAKQIKNENFKWASSGASSIANVQGFANKMPDNFDPYNSNTFADVDLRTSPPPTISYDEERFDENQKVFFDIVKDIDKERCLFCHSTSLNIEVKRFYAEQEDVHTSAGMSCVDCHKNGINHKMISGYPEEYADKKDELLRSFSCEGCHIRSEVNFTSGRYGAPMPLHEGIPSIHFEKLSCTVCHSSFIPGDNTNFIKTSRSHKLGVPGPNKMPLTFPLVQSPVFVRGRNDKIEPRNLLWPSYWGEKKDEKIIPLKISFVEENIQPQLKLDSLYNFGEWPGINDSTLISVLDSVNKLHSGATVVFISGGKMYELLDDKKLITEDINEANPFSWPIAHNVRPAQQSLGINGCEDCHSINSNFYFGDVSIISSLGNESSNRISMINFEGLNTIYETIFSFSFYFRSFLKFLIILCTLIISLTVLSYVFGGIKSFTEYLSDNTNNK